MKNLHPGTHHFCPWFMVGWFCFFLKKISEKPLWTWPPPSCGLLREWVWLLIWWHLLDLLCWRVRGLSVCIMEKWIGSWGLSKKHGNLKIVVTPPRIFFLGVYLMYIFYIILSLFGGLRIILPFFFCEEGSGKYGWLYGILGWLRVNYPNVRVIGKSTYLSMKLIQWWEIPPSQLGLGLYFPRLPLFLLQGTFFEAKGTCQWWLERTPESSKSQGSNDSINKFKLVFPGWLVIEVFIGETWICHFFQRHRLMNWIFNYRLMRPSKPSCLKLFQDPSFSYCSDVHQPTRWFGKFKDCPDLCMFTLLILKTMLLPPLKLT